MQLLVLPVSGGGFVNQLAIIQHLCTVKYKPDVTLGSSGGNVAAYVAAAAQWKWAGITRIAHQLSKDLFVTSWNSINFISFIIGFYRRSIFQQGKGVQSFFNDNFTYDTITKYEIWTGTYNNNIQKARLFCNKKQDNCTLDVNYLNGELLQTMAPYFADGDIDIISKATVASASIPAIVPPQLIENESYIDGGMCGASPLTLMQSVIHHEGDIRGTLHITYVNSIDLAAIEHEHIHNAIDNWKQATHHLVRSKTLIDRLTAYQILNRYTNEIVEEKFYCTYENLLYVKKLREKVCYSLLELYPIEENDVNITSFNGQDVIDKMNYISDKCYCRFWYAKCIK
jgi:predicted acylesterase/phospholipase RssA